MINAFDLAGKDLEDILELLSAPLRAHSRRVAVCSSMMAEYAEKTYYVLHIPDGADLPLLAHLGGTCHDIGKLIIRELDLHQADYPLHPTIGAVFLEKHKDTLFDSEAQALVAVNAARHHHERPDGTGYPDRLRGNVIPLTACICAVANWADHRFMAGAKPGDILKGVKAQVGTLFTEHAAVCFERAWPQLLKQYAKIPPFS